MATKLLVDMGCMVYKVQHPNRKDYTLSVLGQEAYDSVNKGKLEILIDYEVQSTELEDLIASSDVIIEQFRPGAMKSWNLDFDRVKQINPTIIYVSLTGYGQTGDKSLSAGHDLNYMAESGLLGMHRDENGKPILPGVLWADIVGGGYDTAIKILAALLARNLSNMPEAQYIDSDITANMKKITPIAQYFNQIPNTPVRKLLSGDMVNYQIYQTSDGQFVAFAGLEAKFWSAFANAIGRADWAKKSMFDLHRSAFPQKELKDVFLSKTAAEWSELSQKYDLCISTVS
jgi:crotonobetainyl-CoA:carnitine CoA-transferase CaiB-like acyl-CoA transferase